MDKGEVVVEKAAVLCRDCQWLRRGLDSSRHWLCGHTESRSLVDGQARKAEAMRRASGSCRADGRLFEAGGNALSLLRR